MSVSLTPPCRYVADTWNKLDIVEHTFFIGWAVVKLSAAVDATMQEHSMRAICASCARAHVLLSFNGLTMCLRLLHIALLNEGLGIQVLMVVAMVRDLVLFLGIFITITAGYAISMSAIFGPSVDGYRNWGAAFFTLFQSALGDFDFDVFDSGVHESDESPSDSTKAVNTRGGYLLGCIFLTTYLLLNMLLLLNILIAKFSSTYAAYERSSRPQWCMLKA
jgi:hypothetical protein